MVERGEADQAELDESVVCEMGSGQPSLDTAAFVLVKAEQRRLETQKLLKEARRS